MITAAARMARSLSASVFVRQSGLMFAATGVSSLLFLVGMTILARLYPIDSLGAYYTLTALSVIVSLIMLMGYNAALPVATHTELPSLILGMTGLAMVVTLALLPVSLIHPHWWFVLAAAWTQWLPRLAEALMIRQQRLRLVAALRILSTFVVYGSLFAAWKLVGPSLPALFCGQLIGTLLLAVAYAALVWGHGGTRLSLSEAVATLRRHLDFCRYNGPAQILSNVVFQIPLFAAAHYFSPAIAAQYNLANKFTIAPLTIFGEAVSRVYTGYLAKRHADQTDLFANYKRLLLGLLGLGAAIAAASALFVPFIITHFFGADWHPAITYILAMLPLTFALIAFNPLASLFPFIGGQRFFFGLQLVSVTCVLASCAIGVWQGDFTLAILCLSLSLCFCYGAIALYLGKRQN